MGFGRGKGFTSRVSFGHPKYKVKGGGGKKTASHQVPNPTYTVTVS